MPCARAGTLRLRIANRPAMSDEFDYGASTGNPAGYIVGSIGEGLSSTAALNAYREAGGSIRTQTWYRLYGEVTDSLARSPVAGQLDPDQLPGGGDYATWTMGKGKQFATQVQVYHRDLDTGIVGTSNFTYVTDYAHTPGEAEEAAFNEYSDPDNASEYGQAVLGTATVNVYQTIAM